MRLSIIVPAYNIENYIGRCLVSLINQTEKDMEIIVVDDGSTDRTAEIIDEIDDCYPGRLKIIHKQNGGASRARNLAISMAKGDYIGFVDGDDYVDLSMYEKMLNKAKEDGADVVTCGYYRIKDGHFYAKRTEKVACFSNKVLQEPELFLNNVPYLWNKIFSRELIARSGVTFYEDLRIYEDLVFTYTLLLHARKISQVTEPFYNYVNRGGSLTNLFTEKRFDLFKAFDHLILEFKKADSFYHFEDELQYIYEEHMYVAAKQSVAFKNIPLKNRFIAEAFRYGQENFANFDECGIYFEHKKKNKELYRSKSYWYLRSFLPNKAKDMVVEGRQFIREKHFTISGQYYYDFYFRKPIIDNRIFLLSQHGQNPNGNMFYLLKALLNDEAFKNYEVCVGVAKGKEHVFRKLFDRYGFNNRVKFVQMYSKMHAEVMASAKYLITDTSFSNWFVKRSEQVVINTWHGTPLKTLGKATANDYYDIANVQKNFLISDYLLYQNDFTKEQMLRDYMIGDIYEGTIVKYGYPRNEVFFEEEAISKVRTAFELADKKVYAYMPTYRGNVRAVNKSQEEEIADYLRRMDELLEEDELIYVNLHPYVANKINYDSFRKIRPFPSSIETYEFLAACDALITDYSSVFFDYACTGRPIYLFTYDEKEYFKERGVYIEMSELPFARLETPEQIVMEIHTNGSNKCQGYDEFVKTYCKYDEKNSADKFLRQVILGEDTGITMEKSERKDSLQTRSVLIFTNNFDNILEEKNMFGVTEVRNAIHEPDATVYFFYDTVNLHANKSYLKKMPKEFRFFGTLGAFSFVTFPMELKIRKWKKRMNYTQMDVERIYTANKKPLEFEARRMYGGYAFDRVSRLGKVSLCDALRIKALRTIRDKKPKE